MDNFTPIYDKLLSDYRFLNLTKTLNDYNRALGMCVTAYRLANQYWLSNENPGSLIPKEIFIGFDLMPLAECGLAKETEDGIYMCGIKYVGGLRLDTLNQRSDAGKRSAASRIRKYGSAVPFNAPHNNPNGDRTNIERRSNDSRTTSNDIEQVKLSKVKIREEKKREEHPLAVEFENMENKDIMRNLINPSNARQKKWLQEYSITYLNSQLERFQNYIHANGKTYKDYAAAFSNWLGNKFGPNNISIQKKVKVDLGS